MSTRPTRVLAAMASVCAISVFAIDKASGRLTYTSNTPTGGCLLCVVIW